MKNYSLRTVFGTLTMLILCAGALHAQDRNSENAFSSLKPGRGFYLYKESAKDILARFKWFSEPRRSADGSFSYDTRIEAWKHARTMSVYQPNVLMKNGKVSAATWVNIGPVNQGGRITGVAIHPTDPNTVYFTAAAGGIWKSTNGGDDFDPIADDLPTMSMGAITIDPTNPNTIWVGTGEANGNADAYPGIGVIKSTDAGSTWELTGLKGDTRVAAIRVHPEISDIVLAATMDGIRRTEDNGVTWSTVHNSPAFDLVVHPQKHNIWYAGLWGVGVVRSTDTGRTWESISESWETELGLEVAKVRRIALDLCKSSPDVIYTALVESGSYSLYGILKSTDGGDSWTMLPTPGTDFFSEQGFFNCDLAVDPEDPDRLLIGGLRIYLSENGGEGWTTRYPSHVDQHALEFAPSDPDIFYAGHDGGIDRSSNGGRNFTSKNGNLPITQFYDFDVSYQNPDLLIGGAQDNGSAFSTSSSSLWKEATGADGTYCVIDYTDSNVMYTQMQYAQYRWRTTDGGSSWTRITTGIDDEGPWVTPTVIDPKDHNTLYTCTYYDFYKTTNRGGQWVQLSSRVTTSAVMNYIAVSPVNTSIIATGYSGTGGIALSTDGGVTWERLVGPFPRTTVTDIEFSSTDERTLYATFSGSRTNSVYKTTDGGATWENISGNLPAIPTNTIVVNPTNISEIFVGTDFGVYITTNGGEDWEILGEGMPKVPVVDMHLHLATGKLRAATHGRSIYELTVTTSAAVETFTASLDGRDAMLVWRTTQEMNNAGFAIERKDGAAEVWNEIGYVEGNGSAPGTFTYTFVDRALPSGTDAVVYRIRQIGLDGSFEYSHEVMLALGTAVPFELALDQNYPNPFNPVTTIRYTVTEPGRVRLLITDEKGVERAVLFDGEKLPGSYTVQFDADRFPSGVYFYHLLAEGRKLTRRMVVLK